MTIRQIPSTVTGDATNEIDLTPALPINDYTNIGPNGEVLDEPPAVRPSTRRKPHPPKKPPRPPEMQNGSPELYSDAQSRVPMPQNHYGNQPPRPQDSPDEDLYGNREVERVLAENDRKLQRLDSNEYEDAEALDKMAAATNSIVSHTPAGTYDNPDEIMASVGGARGAVSSKVSKYKRRPPSGGGGVLKEGVYDIAETNEAELYDDAASVEPRRISQTPMSPKFDDVIYMKQGETPSPPLVQKPLTPPLPHSRAGIKPPPARKPPALRNMSKNFNICVYMCTFLSQPVV